MQSDMDRSCHTRRLTTTFLQNWTKVRPDPLRLEPFENLTLPEAHDPPELEAGKPARLEPVEDGRRGERKALGELGRGEQAIAHATCRERLKVPFCGNLLFRAESV